MCDSLRPPVLTIIADRERALSAHPSRQQPLGDPDSTEPAPAPQPQSQTIAFPRAKVVALIELLEPCGLHPAIFPQEVGLLFLSSVSDQVVVNFCSAAAAFLPSADSASAPSFFPALAHEEVAAGCVGIPPATLLLLCTELIAQHPPSAELTEPVFTEYLRAAQLLRKSEDQEISERAILLPNLTALVLLRPRLSGPNAASSVRALGEILALAPSDSDLHRFRRDIDPLLTKDATTEDLCALASLLRGQRFDQHALRSFCSLVPAMRAWSPEDWGKARDATLSALGAGLPNAWSVLAAYDRLRLACPSPSVRAAFLDTVAKIAADRDAAGVLPDFPARLSKLWSSFPPPGGTCRKLLSSSSAEGATGLLARVIRTTARGFERGEPEAAHYQALSQLAGFAAPASDLEGSRASSLRRLALLRRVGDLATGFSNAFEFDLRHLPGQAVGALARAALAHGQLKLVHARAPRAVPVDGVLITDFLRAAVRSPTQSPFSALCKSLEGFGEKLPLIAGSRFLCAPGLLAFSPPDHMRLKVGLEGDQSFSLLLFGKEQHQASVIHALLVDSDWLHDRIQPSLFEPEIAVGNRAPRPEGPDLHSLGLQPETILRENRDGKVVALDIASPSVLLRGFAAATAGLFGDAPPPTLGRDAGRYLVQLLDLFAYYRIALAHAHKGLAAIYSVPAGAPASGERRAARLTPLLDVLARHLELTALGGSHEQPTDPMLVTTSAEWLTDLPDRDLIFDVRSLELRIHGLGDSRLKARPPITDQATERAWLDRATAEWIEKAVPLLRRNPCQDLRFVERRALARR